MTYFRKLPGFRSGTGWKMSAAGMGYLLVLLVIAALLVPPGSLEARLDDARAATERGSYEQAVEYYDALLADWDDEVLGVSRQTVEAERDDARQQWAGAVLSSAEDALSAGNLDQAEELLNRARSIFPGLSSIESVEQQLAFRRARYEAEELLVAAADTLSTADLNAARTSLEKVHTLAPDHEHTVNLYAELQRLESRAAAQTADASLVVHFIDVGQGDATLLEGPDFTILIDAGRHDRNDVVPYLQLVGTQEIDLLIGTHPHADHIGQFDRVLQAFPVREVWMSGDEHTTRTFERTLDAILASDAGYHEPRAGEVFTFGSAIIEVVNPDRLTGDLHEGSISVRIVYGDVTFMFTGDAEAQTEQAMIQRGHDLRAQILQLGHHGSRTSSTQAFLGAVQPEVAIYSAGLNNQYGHPHGEVMDRLASMEIPAYGTAVHGTILVSTDGRDYRLETTRDGDPRAPPSDDDGQDGGTDATASGCAPGQVEVNSASFEDLQQIIHIGEVQAQELISLRPFSSVDDLTRIDGIGPSRISDIREQNVACVP